MPSEKAADLAMSVLEAPAIAPDHEAPKADAVKADAPKADAPNAEPPKLALSKTEAPRMPGKLMIMSPGERVWHDHSASAEVKSETRTAPPPPPAAAPKRSFGSMAAMLAVATIAGAIGGALATSSLTRVADAAATTPVAATTPASGALEASIARIDADMVALKAGLEHASKQGVTQFNKTNDRLEKIEKAQAEPTAKLAKLTEAVDKLRAAPAPAVVAAAPAAADHALPVPKDVTGSVTPPQQAVAAVTPAAAPAQAAAPKTEVGRLPTVEGWSIA